MKKIDGNLMKHINLNLVRQVMKSINKATKPQLSELTNLSVVTVNSLIKELLSRGEIFEDKVAPSNGGRPALTYRFNYDYSSALVIYMREKQGQELISLHVVNLDAQILYKNEYILPDFDRNHLFKLIDELMERYHNIKVIGIGIPGGMVNGEITVASHQELLGFRMIEELEGKYAVPVVVENDVNAALSGYCAQLKQKKQSCIVGVYFPSKYPPGMGIYVNGDMVRGKNGMAGEIKFLPYGVNWLQSMGQKQFVDNVCRIIHTINAVLAPDEVVMYQDRISSEEWYEGWGSYLQHHAMASTPEVILLDTFQEDIESGMRWLTLKRLESLDSELE